MSRTVVSPLLVSKSTDEYAPLPPSAATREWATFGTSASWVGGASLELRRALSA